MSNKPILCVTALLVAFGLFTFSSCSKDDAATATSHSYTGAGSRWGATLNSDLSFTINHFALAGDTTADMTVSGTYKSLSYSFLLLTVGSCSTPSGSAETCPAAGATAYGFEIPGVTFLVKPIGGDGNIISMIGEASCPTTTFNANYMKVQTDSGWDSHGNDTYGTFTYTPVASGATGDPVVPTRFALDGTSLSSEDFGSGSCSSGVLKFSTPGGEVDIFLNSSGGAVVHTGVGNGAGNDGIIVGLPQPSSAVTVSSLAGTYGGLAFVEAQAKNMPVKLTLAVGGGGVTGTGTEIDVTTGVAKSGGGSAVITLTGNTPKGFVTGTVSTDGVQTEPLACMVEQHAGSSGKTGLICAGADSNAGVGTATAANFFSIVLVSQ